MSARISRTLGLLAVLVMTAAAWPNPVAAQTGASETGANKQHEVNFFLGGLYTQNKLPLNAGFNTGFRYAYKVYQNFWLELETGLTFTLAPVTLPAARRSLSAGRRGSGRLQHDERQREQSGHRFGTRR
jgi:hypothetical protein